MMLQFLLAVTLSCAIQPSAQTTVAGPVKEDVPGVVNFVRVTNTFASGGAITPDAIPELKARGYTTIINLRSADEAGANVEAEEAAVEAAGLRYAHIPTTSTDPLTEESIASFLSAVSGAAGGKVFAHCAGGNRASGHWLVKRVRVDKWSVDQAVAEALAMGMRDNVKAAALLFVKH
jgi:uncharacterized protein (TIGR01244 family)